MAWNWRALLTSYPLLYFQKVISIAFLCENVKKVFDFGQEEEDFEFCNFAWVDSRLGEKNQAKQEV